MSTNKKYSHNFNIPKEEKECGIEAFSNEELKEAIKIEKRLKDKITSKLVTQKQAKTTRTNSSEDNNLTRDPGTADPQASPTTGPPYIKYTEEELIYIPVVFHVQHDDSIGDSTNHNDEYLIALIDKINTMLAGEHDFSADGSHFSINHPDHGIDFKYRYKIANKLPKISLNPFLRTAFAVGSSYLHLDDVSSWHTPETGVLRDKWAVWMEGYGGTEGYFNCGESGAILRYVTGDDRYNSIKLRDIRINTPNFPEELADASGLLNPSSDLSPFGLNRLETLSAYGVNFPCVNIHVLPHTASTEWSGIAAFPYSYKLPGFSPASISGNLAIKAKPTPSYESLDILAKTLLHELGHSLGLYHTFEDQHKRGSIPYTGVYNNYTTLSEFNVPFSYTKEGEELNYSDITDDEKTYIELLFNTYIPSWLDGFSIRATFNNGDEGTKASATLNWGSEEDPYLLQQALDIRMVFPSFWGGSYIEENGNNILVVNPTISEEDSTRKGPNVTTRIPFCDPDDPTKLDIYWALNQNWINPAYPAYPDNWPTYKMYDEFDDDGNDLCPCLYTEQVITSLDRTFTFTLMGENSEGALNEVYKLVKEGNFYITNPPSSFQSAGWNTTELAYLPYTDNIGDSDDGVFELSPKNAFSRTTHRTTETLTGSVTDIGNNNNHVPFYFGYYGFTPTGVYPENIKIDADALSESLELETAGSGIVTTGFTDLLSDTLDTRIVTNYSGGSSVEIVGDKLSITLKYLLGSDDPNSTMYNPYRRPYHGLNTYVLGDNPNEEANLAAVLFGGSSSPLENLDTMQGEYTINDLRNTMQYTTHIRWFGTEEAQSYSRTVYTSTGPGPRRDLFSVEGIARAESFLDEEIGMYARILAYSEEIGLKNAEYGGIDEANVFIAAATAFIQAWEIEEEATIEELGSTFCFSEDTEGVGFSFDLSFEGIVNTGSTTFLGVLFTLSGEVYMGEVTPIKGVFHINEILTEGESSTRLYFRNNLLRLNDPNIKETKKEASRRKLENIKESIEKIITFTN